MTQFGTCPTDPPNKSIFVLNVYVRHRSFLLFFRRSSCTTATSSPFLPTSSTPFGEALIAGNDDDEMQRRIALKSSAHIAEPRDGDGGILSSNGGAYPFEKPLSKLNQRTFGLTNRIWLILGLFLTIILFTKFVLPVDPSLPRHGLTNANLKAKNYINSSDADPSPFPFCPLFGPGDELGNKYGVHALAKTRLHLGSGARVQRVIHKALSGLPVTISVLGGSSALFSLCDSSNAYF